MADYYDNSQGPMLQTPASFSGATPAEADLRGQMFLRMAGVLRGAAEWFLSAHHQTKGVGFVGDHNDLYGRIYRKLIEQVDSIVERGIGITGNLGIADAIVGNRAAGVFLESHPLDARPLATQALSVCKAVTAELEECYRALEDADQLTLGLTDLIPQLASEHEVFCYLLNQRATPEGAAMSGMPGAFTKTASLIKASRSFR